MPNTTNLAIFYIKIDGTDLTPDLLPFLTEIVVDTSLHMPDMVTIRLADPHFEWSDNTTLDLGKEIVVSTNVGSSTVDLVKAELTALEPNFEADGSTSLLIRGYDKSNRLRFGKKSRTFLKKTDSDVAKTIAGEAGLQTGTVDTTATQYDWLIQYNQTNMEFITERATRIGYRVYAHEGKLNFVKAGATGQPAATLTYAMDLTSFRPRLTVTRQAGDAKVRGWDPAKKQAIVGTSTAPAAWNTIGYGKEGNAALKSAFGASSMIIVDEPVKDKAEADAMALGRLSEMGGGFIEAEGVCVGNPKVQAGALVKLDKIGTRFSGNYYVTEATHVWTPDSGYVTYFTASGGQPNTVNHLLEKERADNGRGRIHDVVIGIVTNLLDPENKARVKVKYPWLDDTIESDWARLLAPSAGPNTGIQFMPEVNDEVLVAFEHGDPARPYVLGALWNGKDAPPLANNVATKGGKVIQRIIQSRTGHKIILNDSDDAPSITIIDKTGSNKVFIDSKNNKIEVDAKMDINITAGGNMKFTAKGNVDIDATGNLTMKAKGNGTLESTGKMGIKGTAGLTAESTAMTEVKGMTVSVAGNALTEVKGPLVKIN